LTSEAEPLFPKAYDALLNQLIGVLKGGLTPAALDEVLREVGRSLAAVLVQIASERVWKLGLRKRSVRWRQLAARPG